MFLVKWAIQKNPIEGVLMLLVIIADEIKVMIDETVKQGVSKEDFLLWTEENSKRKPGC